MAEQELHRTKIMKKVVGVYGASSSLLESSDHVENQTRKEVTSSTNSYNRAKRQPGWHPQALKSATVFTVSQLASSNVYCTKENIVHLPSQKSARRESWGSLPGWREMFAGISVFLLRLQKISHPSSKCF